MIINNEDAMDKSQSVISIYSHDEEDLKSVASLQATSIVSNKLGEADTRWVNRSKCMVFFVLFLSAFLCGAVTYFFMEEEDIRWYTAEFDERSQEVFNSVQDVLGRSLQAGEHMAAGLILETAHKEVQLPNLTYSTFGITSGHLMKYFSGGQMMGVAHSVSANDRARFEAYAVEHQDWIDYDHFLYDLYNDRPVFTSIREEGTISEHIYGNTNETAQLSAPLWQMYPTPTNGTQAPIMFDLMSFDWFKEQWDFSLALRNGKYQTSIGSIHEDINFLVDYASVGNESPKNITDPKFLILEPSHGGFVPKFESMIVIAISWTEYFEDILQDQPAGVVVELHDDCPSSDGDKYFFRSNKDSVIYIGKNIENPNILPSLSNHYTLYGESLTEYLSDFSIAQDSCGYAISVHATKEFIEQWQRDISYLAAFFIVAAFGFTAVVFFMYTYFVQKRNRLVTSTAERSTAIVSSLFPKNVADQMMLEVQHEPTSSKGRMKDAIQILSGSSEINTDRSALDSSDRKEPIADHFAATTIMFADIAGFTAWSAKREPKDVFTLLETIFDAFDRHAERRGVFKVETVGDCFVAVCGLPDPRQDHAVVMAKFACDCRNAMKKVKRKLEKELGPDTAHLDMRFGLHSGPVTAGVIRGKTPRFQLFGDSMNKTSRIETSGEKGRIHISEEMANILKDQGKQNWISKREDVVHLKGLGAVPTYWLIIDSDWMASRNSLASVAATTATESEEFSSEDEFNEMKPVSNKSKKMSKLIACHSKHLFECLSKVAQARKGQHDGEIVLQAVEREAVFGHAEPLDCIQFDDSIQSQPNGSSPTTPLHASLLKQLEDFVQEIAGAYNPHAFHNVHHASHVALSLQKVMQSFESSLDPLSQFAILIAALVHDVDHQASRTCSLLKRTMLLQRSMRQAQQSAILWMFSGTSLAKSVFLSCEEPFTKLTLSLNTFDK
ncbi:unnamed protein product [Cylindrotheca closterium]|uniref:Guanylate cyclase domain-containing protein n=1 Tax=Cylindrotheca closterium TaxID=2856 RepID=A0AAD2PUZ8_9STRA|nr:unnamed protein product [Cylindrotheca closterium]